jgi:hypothetical protein
MPHSHIVSVINSFDPISLSKMDQVKLMNRIDTKHVLSYAVLLKVLKEVTDSYYILEMERLRQFPYVSLYFDTLDDMMYKSHHNGKLNRHKIRLRKYVSSNHTFLEIKEKVKGIRTQKTGCL